MNFRRHTAKNEAGFTIVELMIATAILSTILAFTSVMMIGIGRLYYKGINQARVQDTVRSVTDEISQKLQLSDQPTQYLVEPGPTPLVASYCIGNTRYSFVLHRQISSDTLGDHVRHVLWRDTVPSTGCAALTTAAFNSVSSDPSPGGTELMVPNSRLTSFNITGNVFYSITVGIAYGDQDLLSDPNAPDPTCNGGIGGQFCATASLATTVTRRITGP